MLSQVATPVISPSIIDHRLIAPIRQIKCFQIKEYLVCLLTDGVEVYIIISCPSLKLLAHHDDGRPNCALFDPISSRSIFTRLSNLEERSTELPEIAMALSSFSLADFNAVDHNDKDSLWIRSCEFENLLAFRLPVDEPVGPVDVEVEEMIDAVSLELVLVLVLALVLALVLLLLLLVVLAALLGVGGGARSGTAEILGVECVSFSLASTYICPPGRFATRWLNSPFWTAPNAWKNSSRTCFPHSSLTSGILLTR